MHFKQLFDTNGNISLLYTSEYGVQVEIAFNVNCIYVDGLEYNASEDKLFDVAVRVGGHFVSLQDIYDNAEHFHEQLMNEVA